MTPEERAAISAVAKRIREAVKKGEKPPVTAKTSWEYGSIVLRISQPKD